MLVYLRSAISPKESAGIVYLVVKSAQKVALFSTFFTPFHFLLIKDPSGLETSSVWSILNNAISIYSSQLIKKE